MSEDVALPSGQGINRANAPTTYHEHPGERIELVCPNCFRGDKIEIDVPLVVTHTIDAWVVDAAGWPDYVVTESHDLPGDQQPEDPIRTCRCGHCKWSFTGDNPLTKLVRK